jgi:endoglucanase
MKKILAILSMAAVSAMAVSASRVGPVSTYGELKATKINNKGQLVGSCPQYADKAVQVKGMSLFWSSAEREASDFYSANALNLMVQDMGIEVIRFALGVDEKDGGSNESSNRRFYVRDGENDQKARVKSMVYSAVQNDIYIIIDWHVETANNAYTEKAKDFFTWAAKEFGKTNNVIFEVWNEPTDRANMSNVATHANAVIKAIRDAGSDNLVLVGSPGWSSQPNDCANAGIQDPKNNFACTLHFYAASHSQSGDYAKNAQKALDAGVPVFASEWGTVNAQGNGSPDESESQKWVNWMAQNKISWANWSASAKSETSAAFSTNIITDGLKYTSSGNWIKDILTSGSHSYSDCGLENYVGSKTSDDGFSTGVANGAQTDFIDDFEDGDHYTYTGGQWSAWTDASSEKKEDGTGKTSISNTKFVNEFGKSVYEVLKKTSDLKNAGSENTSKYVAAMEDIYIDAGDWNNGGYQWDPYAIIGLNFTKDTTEFANFKNCKSISYKYKGAAHNFRVEISSITNYNFHYYSAPPSDSWTSLELTMDMLKQHDDWQNPQITALASSLGKAKRLAWEVNGKAKTPAGVNQPTYKYLYIDDVRCDGLSVTAISGGEKPASSSSSKNVESSSSSSAIVPVESSSSNSIVPVVSSSSSTQPTIVDLFIIDDVEDADEVLKTTGTWYAYNDSVPGGKSSMTNTYDPELPGYVVVFPGTTDPSNGTAGFVGVTGVVWKQADYTEAPFVALGLNMMADTSMGYDMSKCSGISYRYKGSAHIFKVIDGQVQDYAYHQKGFSDATEWTTVVLAWNDIQQPRGWGKEVELNHANIKKMAWEVVGYKGLDLQPEINYLYVDDLKCIDDGSVGIRMARKSASDLKLAVNGNMLNVVTTAAARIQVFDMMGNLVASRVENAAGNHQVSLENVNRGNYVVRVKSAGITKTARVSIR